MLCGAATDGKAPQGLVPRFWLPIRSNNWSKNMVRIFGLAELKFAVAALLWQFTWPNFFNTFYLLLSIVTGAPPQVRLAALAAVLPIFGGYIIKYNLFFQMGLYCSWSCLTKIYGGDLVILCTCTFYLCLWVTLAFASHNGMPKVI